MNVQIAVFEIQRDFQTLALDRGEQSRIDVEIDRVAKLVTFTSGSRLDAG